mgnify:FL=1
MQTPHFELMENHKVKLLGFDHLAEQFICVVKNQYIFLQPITNDQIYDDCHLLISKTNENIVQDSVFYRLIKLTHSDQYQYFYVISTNSYIPSLV